MSSGTLNRSVLYYTSLQTVNQITFWTVVMFHHLLVSHVRCCLLLLLLNRFSQLLPLECQVTVASNCSRICRMCFPYF